MNTFLKILLLVIFVIIVVKNINRGFAKSLCIIVGCVVSLGVAVKISDEYSEKLYENLWEESVLQIVNDNVEDFDSAKIINENLFKKTLGITTISDEKIRQTLLLDGKISENLSNLAKKENSGVDINEILEYIDKNSFFKENDSEKINAFLKEDNFEKAVRILANDDKKTRTDAFYTQIVKPYIVTVVRYTVALVLFLVIFSVLKFVILKINILEKIPVAGFLNALLGGVVGVVEGFVIIAFVRNIFENQIVDFFVEFVKLIAKR